VSLLERGAAVTTVAMLFARQADKVVTSVQ
jgi:hypothetical protein